LTLHWLLAGAAVIVALAAWAKARRLAKRLERLTELRYEHGQLRARVNRLDPEMLPAAGDSAPAGAPGTAFVPLSSLKTREPAQK